MRFSKVILYYDNGQYEWNFDKSSVYADVTNRIMHVKARFFLLFISFDTLNLATGKFKSERIRNMKENEKRILILGSVFTIAFIVWTYVIQTVDVQPVGQNGTDIGFATWNLWFHKLTGVNMLLYTITDWMGLVPLFVCMRFAGIGFCQLVQRISSVNKSIYWGYF